MPETFQSNQIAIGHNNTAGLTNIEAIAVDGIYFVVQDDLGKWNFGADVLYGNGINGTQGFQSTRWVSGVITLAQYAYIYNTILVGALSGLVTIRTRQLSATTYANYNATLTIPSPDKLDKTTSGDYQNFVWLFTHLTAL